MKKVIALVLAISLITMILSGCSSDLPDEYVSRISITFTPYSIASITTEIRSDKFVFNTDGVTLDLYLGLFYNEAGDAKKIKKDYLALKNQNESYEVTDALFVVYASKNPHFEWYSYENEPIHKNVVGKEILKTITLDEAIDGGLWYTTKNGIGKSGKVNYNNSIKITIPEEFFDTEQKSLYITVYQFNCCLEDGVYKEYPGNYSTRIKIKYIVKDKTTIELIN